MSSTAAIPLSGGDAFADVIEGLSWRDFGLAGSLVGAVADGEIVGPGMYAFLGEVDSATLAADERVDLIRALERAAAMIAGLQQYALASVVDATTASGLAGEEARHEVGAALRLSPGTAGDRTRVAAVLRDQLPGTMAALVAGDINYLQAAAVADSVRDLSQDLAAAVEARVIPKIRHQTSAETRRTCRAAVEALDPEGCADRHRKAVTARTLERMALRDAMESTWFALPAGMSADFWSVLSADAREQKSARRALGLADPGIDALRVDALVHAVLHNGGVDPDFPRVTLTDGKAPSPAGSPAPPPAESAPTARASHSSDPSDGSHAPSSATGRRRPSRFEDVPRQMPRCSCGRRQTAAVVIDLPTLLGLATTPGELPGYGAVPAGVARSMAADRDWVRWTVDPGTRQVIDRGARSYRPSAAMLAFIAARDRVCGFPGCSQPAKRCDCDHITTFDQDGPMPSGGGTIAVNLGPLCRQHHNAKTHGRWRLAYDPDAGVKTWISPLGKRYDVGTDPPLL